MQQFRKPMSPPTLLTLQDVSQTETACLTAGHHAAFTSQAMLFVLRSYRQAVAIIRFVADREPAAAAFLEVVDSKPLVEGEVNDCK